MDAQEILSDIPVQKVKGNPRGSGYERAEHEWYVEQPSAVRALLRNEIFRGSIHDPACGGGNIPRTFAEAGYSATGADIVDRGFGEIRDFLTDKSVYGNIVTNPPFRIASDFTEHALESLVSDDGRKVCILQRLAWLEGMDRYRRLFADRLLHRVWVFRGRISMPPGGVDVPARNGSVAYAWFVFQRTPAASTVLGWI